MLNWGELFPSHTGRKPPPRPGIRIWPTGLSMENATETLAFVRLGLVTR